MPKTEIHFLGLLANTDSTILQVKLENSFELAEMPKNEFVRLVAAIDRREWFETFKDLSIPHYIPPDNEGDSCIVVKNKLTAIIEFDSQDRPKPDSWWQPVCDFQNKCVEEYLKPIVRLMRLFKEGTICLPIARYFYYRSGIPRLLLGTPVDSCLIVGPHYILEEQEVTRLQIFLQKTSLPFGESFLQLAFDSFELSYEIHDRALAFLSLMIALEVMFTKEREGLSYALARNTAALLGETEEKAKEIFGEIKSFCRKRGNLVHAGEKKEIKPKNVLKLRDYVRKSIQEINSIGKSKNEVLEILKACGFGQRPWRDEC